MFECTYKAERDAALNLLEAERKLIQEPLRKELQAALARTEQERRCVDDLDMQLTAALARAEKAEAATLEAVARAVLAEQRLEDAEVVIEAAKRDDPDMWELARAYRNKYGAKDA